MLALSVSRVRRTVVSAGRRNRRRCAVGIGLMAGVSVLAACGGGGTHVSAATTTTAAANSAAAYRACLQQHGVSGSFGRRGGGAGAGGTSDTTASTSAAPATSVDPAALQAAQQACQSLAPARGSGGGFGGGGFGGGGGGGFANLAGTPYGQCLQQHGVSLGTDTTGGAGIDRTSAAFQQAQTACASLRPARGGQNPPTTATS